MLLVESFITRKFKLNPFEIERCCTIFDFYVYVDRLLDDISAENDELNKSGKESEVIRSLRYVRNVLNKLNLGD